MLKTVHGSQRVDAPLPRVQSVKQLLTDYLSYLRHAALFSFTLQVYMNVGVLVKKEE